VILSIDQGTTGTTVLLFNTQGDIVKRGYKEIKQFFPQSGWVEHDANEIWQSVDSLIKDVRANDHIQGIGITNQRETVVVWDKKTGQPIYKAIVWQCRRTAPFCDMIKQSGKAEWIREKTGLVVDAYFSASKIRWILDQSPEFQQRAEAGELCFGTIDSWLIWKLTSGEHHVTDHTNASRTMLYNLEKMDWDDELFSFFNIPIAMRPTLVSSVCNHIQTQKQTDLPNGIPIAGIAGDQQAALFGQGCVEEGMIKNTYGTGCFMLMYTGSVLRRSNNGLLSTMACAADGSVAYALEGSVFMGGAIIQWIRDELGLIKKASETEAIAESIPNTQGVYVVPAFVGLGAPYWDMEARGTITGLSRGSGKNELIRAALEAIAYQSKDLANLMEEEAGQPVAELRVDGGATENNFLMQFQADQLNTKVSRPKTIETTAFGAALLAGLGVGFWQQSELAQLRKADRVYQPNQTDETKQLYTGWQRAVRQARTL
jgi:glycerol kinase